MLYDFWTSWAFFLKSVTGKKNYIEGVDEFKFPNWKWIFPGGKNYDPSRGSKIEILESCFTSPIKKATRKEQRLVTY